MIKRFLSARTPDKELGFGRSITTTGRIMNADGSFNVVRHSRSVWDNTYYHLVTMPWWLFFLLQVLAFVSINLVFATLYCMVGVEHLNGIKMGGLMDNFTQAYFFSSQTLTTVGYGYVSPMGLPANIIASFESFLGLLTFALVSGLLYGRFSRPSAGIVFSNNMLISPYKDGRAMMFRIVNARRSELIETEAQIILTLNQPDENGNLFRRYVPLELEISKISFFSLSWTLVHPLDDKSPLFGFTEQDMLESHVEVMILIKAIEEANQQTVHIRHSYAAEEIVWNAKFTPVMGRHPKGVTEVITAKIGDFERLSAGN
jgi:inward rectifier potassium channel